MADTSAYQKLLRTDKDEWQALDVLCRITISRFFRDGEVFDFLARQVLPELARESVAAGDATLRAWSAGCGAGEEPYSLALLWSFLLETRFADLRLAITATDSDAHLLKRAGTACYPRGCLRELPPAWIENAFEEKADAYCLKSRFREPVRFLQQDVRDDTPDGLFDLILCRNLAFTYFDTSLQQIVSYKLIDSLRPGGVLVIGRKERLPGGCTLEVWSDAFRVYRRTRQQAAGNRDQKQFRIRSQQHS